MSVVRIQPWINMNELLEVRALLYPRDIDGEPETNRQRRLGVNIVNTWKRRLRVPHAIIATALLIDAIILHQESSKSPAKWQNAGDDAKYLPSPFEVRSVYSTSFARFITGFCDTAPKASVKRSMYDVATELNMPEQWVEVRHEITHGEIPDLRILEQCTNEAIDWLWEYFWTKLASGSQILSIGNRLSLKDLLKSLLRARKDQLRHQKKHDINGILSQIVSSDSHSKDLQGTAETIVSDRLLLPGQKLSNLNMNAAYIIWDDPLQRLCRERIPFYKSIVMALMAELGSLTHTEPENDTEKEAIFFWLEHLLISTQWTTERKTFFAMEDFRPEIMEQCLLYPSVWSQTLAKTLLKTGGEEFRRDWTDMFNASNISIDHQESFGMQKGTNSKDTEMADILESKQTPVSSCSDSQPTGGWKLWHGPWTPRPIGT